MLNDKFFLDVASRLAEASCRGCDRKGQADHFDGV